MTSYKKSIKALVSIVMITAVIWQLCYARNLDKVENNDYAFTDSEIVDLKHFPEAQYAYGQMAWYENRLEKAKRYLTRAIAGNVWDINAWLMLARAELSAGNRKQAKRILVFTNRLTRDTIQWKWEHVLLARDLDLKNIFLENVNAALSSKGLVNDALQMMDLHFHNDVRKVLPVMSPAGRTDYLKWLMRWHRTEDAWHTWGSLTNTMKNENQLYEQFVDFMIRHKEIGKAQRVWQEHTGIKGMTNPGFEQPLSGKGFGWKYRTDDNKCWTLKRTRTGPKSERFALELSFDGTKNICFNHVWQIVPVEPGNEYVLSYWRKSRNLTTDERPFIDIYCYNLSGGSHWSGTMLASDSDWHDERIRFYPPDQCQAVKVQITRNPSHRFGCKISGNTWFDGFTIERLADSPGLNVNQE